MYQLSHRLCQSFDYIIISYIPILILYLLRESMRYEYTHFNEMSSENIENMTWLNSTVVYITHTPVMDNGYREGNYRVSLTPLYRIRPVNIGESKSRSLSH